jgi:DNA recombination protein RmuC
MDPLLFGAVALVVVAALVVALLALQRATAAQRPPETSLQDLSQRMEQLTRIFQTPHRRGVVGETMLAELLANWLPRRQFELQYAFQSGAKADAVVRFGTHLLAIDAKFPAEAISRAMDDPEGSFAEARKAVLRHADAIAERYIRPSEGTFDFALLYLPSEALYRFLFVEHSPELFEELGRRRVIPVSPGTLFLYLQTMLFALSGSELPSERRELAQQLEGIRTELHDFATLFYRAGAHLKNATKNFEEAETQLSRVERHLASLLGRGREGS